MKTIAITITYFLLLVLIHIFMHRVLVSKGIRTFKTIIVFAVGFAVGMYLLFVERIWGIGIETGIGMSIVYALLSVDYVLMIASPFLGDEGPSSKIALLVRRVGPVSKQEILEQFSDSWLIDKRLSDLEKSGMIAGNNGRYRILPRGSVFISLILWYRRVLGWRLVG